MSCREAWPKEVESSGSESKVSINPANTSGSSFGCIRNPVSPGLTKVGTAPTSELITGRAIAMASSTTHPTLSPVVG
eukprot:CAMPEP_0184320744 /NCGR_PEP_ID=MMETSP1049-20130417/115544_1 /TAXON_ID=77928 /ORGANISM="Proteomonas sulcata, Strain CCMP704" /LENGTH=76 /DNA_ID=CAMNT_0026641331 /DNA_START=206 /DNA_END=436 /DNA_ORIENTATION=+